MKETQTEKPERKRTKANQEEKHNKWKVAIAQVL